MAIDIVVFSHLRWDTAPQRTHELLTRLAKSRRIFYVEEPVYTAGVEEGLYELRPLAPNLQRCYIPTPIRAPSFNAKMMPSFLGTINIMLGKEQIEEYLALLYTPLVLPLFQLTKTNSKLVVTTVQPLPQAIIYESLEDASAFARSPELISRDAALTRSADLVIAASERIYSQKRAQRPDLQLIPDGSDDAAWEERSQQLETLIQQLLAAKTA